MTVDDWPMLCQGAQCIGTATPAVWKLVGRHARNRYYCQDHAQRLYNMGYNDPNWWVQLTPNQRPSQVQEVHSGND